LWLLGLFALLVVLTYGLARLMDEPLRRYMEYRVNQCLTGYTVRMRTLHVHPWTVSLDLENATILQDANPDPPVANITKLTVSVDWRGLWQSSMHSSRSSAVRWETSCRRSSAGRSWHFSEKRSRESVAVCTGWRRRRVAHPRGGGLAADRDVHPRLHPAAALRS